jgi:hypothetical protein
MESLAEETWLLILTNCNDVLIDYVNIIPIIKLKMSCKYLCGMMERSSIIQSLRKKYSILPEVKNFRELIEQYLIKYIPSKSLLSHFEMIDIAIKYDDLIALQNIKEHFYAGKPIGDYLSLICKYKSANIFNYIYCSNGDYLETKLNKMLEDSKMSNVFTSSGDFIVIKYAVFNKLIDVSKIKNEEIKNEYYFCQIELAFINNYKLGKGSKSITQALSHNYARLKNLIIKYDRVSLIDCVLSQGSIDLLMSITPSCPKIINHCVLNNIFGPTSKKMIVERLKSYIRDGAHHIHKPRVN